MEILKEILLILEIYVLSLPRKYGILIHINYKISLTEY